ncbi:MAG: hypothetical protein H6Q78_605 [Candidatus Krumholzibacteriota bacterium]|nr:hypothetical protein [Candidatus Krumholzibacteriota bacterium]
MRTLRPGGVFRVALAARKLAVLAACLLLAASILAACVFEAATANAQTTPQTRKPATPQNPAGAPQQPGVPQKQVIQPRPGAQQPGIQNPTPVQMPHRDLATRLRVIAPIIREDPHRAVQMLQGLDREYPRNSEVLCYLGDAYQVMGEIDSALALYGRGLRSPRTARSGRRSPPPGSTTTRSACTKRGETQTTDTTFLRSTSRSSTGPWGISRRRSTSTSV